MKMRFFPDETGGAATDGGGSTDAFFDDGAGTFEGALELPDLSTLLDAESPATPEPEAPKVDGVTSSSFSSTPDGASAPVADESSPEFYKQQYEKLVESHGSLEPVQAWAEFGNQFMDPKGDPEKNYDALANKNPGMFFNMLEVAARHPVNRDHFASLALGAEVSADQVRAAVEAVAGRDPELVARAVQMMERMEADDTDLDAYLPPKEEDEERAQADPEKERLAAELNEFKAEQARTIVRQRRESFESTLDAPMMAELAKLDLSDLDAQWKKATGFDEGLTEMVTSYVRSKLVTNPKFDAAHAHAIRGNEEGVKQYLPALTTIVQNMTRRALAGLGAVAGPQRARKTDTIRKIESEPRLSGGLDVPTTPGGTDLDALFKKRVDSGRNPYDAMSDLEGLL